MMHQPITAAPAPEETAAVARAKPLYAKMQALRMNLHVDDLSAGERARIVADGEGLRAQVVEIAESIGWTESELERVCAAELRASQRQQARPERARGRTLGIMAASRSLDLLDRSIARDEREGEAHLAEYRRLQALILAASGEARLKLERRQAAVNRDLGKARQRRGAGLARRAELLRTINGEAA